MQSTPPRRTPNLDSLHSVNPDGSRNAIYPAAVRGRYQRRKALVWIALIAVYLVVPWLTVGGDPAFLVDVEHRTFYFFGVTFTAQDFWMAFFVITGVAFSLFVVSALWGRLWCGYACPQTVFLEGVFRRIEALFEGSPRKRRELDSMAWRQPKKLLRRGGKLLTFFALAAFLAHSLLGYVMPVREVFRAVVSPPSENPTAFSFVIAFTLLVFVNFTWFREQLCIVVCPYGRLQGALYDAHTLNVGYDAGRGEPRGKVGSQGAGDCVDCRRCIEVCPTGIDIRNGTQMECVGCANCIDACDDVMRHVGRSEGLVRYDSLAGLGGEAKKFWRPRVALYAVLMLLGLAAFTLAATTRADLAIKLLPVAGSPYTLADGVVTQMLTVHVVNKRSDARELLLEASAPDGVEVVLPVQRLELDGLADQRLPVVVRTPRAQFQRGREFSLSAASDGVTVAAAAKLLGPLGPAPSKENP